MFWCGVQGVLSSCNKKEIRHHSASVLCSKLDWSYLSSSSSCLSGYRKRDGWDWHRHVICVSWWWKVEKKGQWWMWMSWWEVSTFLLERGWRVAHSYSSQCIAHLSVSQTNSCHDSSASQRSQFILATLFSFLSVCGFISLYFSPHKSIWTATVRPRQWVS